MKARLPEGMNRGPGNMQSMIRQAQKMQEDMAKLQVNLEIVGDDGTFKINAKVKILMDGDVTKGVDCNISVDIKDTQVVDPEDTEMLADLVMAAVNEAIRQAVETSETEMSKVTGGMNLPGMF